MNQARPARRQASDVAVVLRRFRYHESSLVCHLLTPAFGRVSILAKGAYRPKSAYCGVLDLFDTLRLEWTSGSDLGNLREGSIATRRRNLSRDLDRYRAGLRVLELARLGAREGHEEAELFGQVECALDALQSAEVDPRLASAVFDLRFLGVQGLAPILADCAVCGEAERAAQPGETTSFSPALGGWVCEGCATTIRAESGGSPQPRRSQRGTGGRRGRRGNAPIERRPMSAIRVAESLTATPWTGLARVRLDPRRTEALRSLVHGFLEYHLETRLRATGPAPLPSRSNS